MQRMKETASNVAASAISGLEKTKATTQEKVEKMKTSDPMEKEMARERKDERMTQAEHQKQEARRYNAAGRQTGGTHDNPIVGGTDDFTTSGTGIDAPDYLTGEPWYDTGHAVPRHAEGIVGSQGSPGEFTGQVPNRDTRTGVGHTEYREG